MTSRTFFSKYLSGAVIKDDLRRLWPLSVLSYLVILLCQLAEGMIVGYRYGGFPELSYLDDLSEVSPAVIVGGLMSFLAAYFLFSYLDKSAAVSFMHGVPLSRTRLFFSHTVSWLLLTLFVAVPTLIGYAFMIFPILSASVSLFCGFLLATLGMFLLYSLLAFAIGTFAMLLCGNVILSAILSGVIVLLPAAVLAFVSYVGDQNLIGYSAPSWMEKTVEFLYVFPWQLAESPLHSLLYLGVSLAFLIAAFFLYRIRPLENHGEMMAFPALRPVFTYALGIGCGMFGYLVLSGITGGKSVLLMLPFGILGLIAANMLNKKSFTVRGIAVPLLVFCVVVAFAAFALHFDILGYEKYIPSVDEIDYAETDTYQFGYFYSPVMVSEDDKQYFYLSETPDYHITSREDLEAFTAFHKGLYDAETASGDYHSELQYLSRTLIYHLKNGAVVQREYHTVMPQEEYDRLTGILYNIPVMKSGFYPLVDGIDKELVGLAVCDERTDRREYYPWDKAQSVYDALKRDIERESFEALNADCGTLTITVDTYVDGHYEDGTSPQAKNDKLKFAHSFTVEISPAFTETLSALRKLGYDTDDKDEFLKIEHATVTIDRYRSEYYEKYFDDNGYAYDYVYEDRPAAVATEDFPYATLEYDADYRVSVTDPAELRAVYDYLLFHKEDGYHYTPGDDYVVLNVALFGKDDMCYVIKSFTFTADTLPEAFRKVIKDAL